MCARFNRWVERTIREVVEDGVACCGSAYWNEGDEHEPDCPRVASGPGWRAAA